MKLACDPIKLFFKQCSSSQLCLVMEQFLLLMLFLFSGVRGEENKLFQSQEKKLIRNLLENYTSRGRPLKDVSNCCNIRQCFKQWELTNILHNFNRAYPKNGILDQKNCKSRFHLINQNFKNIEFISKIGILEYFSQISD